MRVSNKSSSSNVAGAIAGKIRLNEVAELDAIGALAVYRTANALAIASDHLSKEGIKISISISKHKVMLSEKEHLLVRFTARNENA